MMNINLTKLFLRWIFTTPVKLIKCLKSIKENAFVASEYPVVITLEDHLTPDLQAKWAQVCFMVFGRFIRHYPLLHNHFPND